MSHYPWPGWLRTLVLPCPPPARCLVSLLKLVMHGLGLSPFLFPSTGFRVLFGLSHHFGEILQMLPCHGWVQRTCGPASLAAGGPLRLPLTQAYSCPSLPLPQLSPCVDREAGRQQCTFHGRSLLRNSGRLPDPRAEGPKGTRRRGSSGGLPLRSELP